MPFFRRIAGLLRLGKDDSREAKHDADDELREQARDRVHTKETGLPRTGFAVSGQVAVDCPNLCPIIVPCAAWDGGIQGLRWYSKLLRIDKDGDVGDEFLDEVLTETSTTMEDRGKPVTRFKVNSGTKPAHHQPAPFA